MPTLVNVVVHWLVELTEPDVLPAPPVEWSGEGAGSETLRSDEEELDSVVASVLRPDEVLVGRRVTYAVWIRLLGEPGPPELSAHDLVALTTIAVSALREGVIRGEAFDEVLGYLERGAEFVPRPECSVCLDRPACVTAAACSHRFGCEECARRVSGCPVCRARTVCFVWRSGASSTCVAAPPTADVEGDEQRGSNGACVEKHLGRHEDGSEP